MVSSSGEGGIRESGEGATQGGWGCVNWVPHLAKPTGKFTHDGHEVFEFPNGDTAVCLQGVLYTHSAYHKRLCDLRRQAADVMHEALRDILRLLKGVADPGITVVDATLMATKASEALGKAGTELKAMRIPLADRGIDQAAIYDDPGLKSFVTPLDLGSVAKVAATVTVTPVSEKFSDVGGVSFEIITTVDNKLECFACIAPDESPIEFALRFSAALVKVASVAQAERDRLKGGGK